MSKWTDVVSTSELFPLLDCTIDELGAAVQNAWAELAAAMPNPPLAWIRTWDEVSEPMKDMDRFIGARVLELIEQKLNESGLKILTPTTTIEVVIADGS